MDYNFAHNIAESALHGAIEIDDYLVGRNADFSNILNLHKSLKNMN